MTTSGRKKPLSKTHPAIAKQAFGWDPSEVTAGSSKKLEWKCPKNSTHKWISTPDKRTGRNQGCPYCANQKILKGDNDLASTHPQLAKEAYGWKPESIGAGFSKKLKWKCAKNKKHIWEASPNSRTSKNYGCPYCTGKLVLKGENDLATHNLKLSKEALGWDPKTVTPGSNKVLKWKCSKYRNHVWKASVYSRNTGSGCPYCTGQKLLKGFNDLKTTHPKIAKEADGWDPAKISAGSHVRLKWRCLVDKSHSWHVDPSNRVNGNLGCPICSNKKILRGYNDLETTHPDLAKEAYGWKPDSISAGSNKILTWRCSNYPKHLWRTKPTSRAHSGTGCPYCSNQKILSGFNDLATTHPEIAKQAYGWDPKKVIAGSTTKKLKWQCSVNTLHIWVTTPSSRTGQKSGCPSCAEYGYSQIKPGYLYFLRHPDWQMYQIGITNTPRKRLAQHMNRGWEVIEYLGPMSGTKALELETKILRMLRHCGADLMNWRIAGKFDGYSESWTIKSFNAKSLATLINSGKKY